MDMSYPERAFRGNRPRDRHLILVASLVVSIALIIAPSSAWRAHADSPFAATPWLLTGNSGTNPATNFLGTTDNHPLVIRTNNVARVAVLPNGNVGIGTTSPAFPLDVKGDINTSTKYDIGGMTVLQASQPLGTTSTGFSALANNTAAGINDSAYGASALASNTTGDSNTAIGYGALQDNNGLQNTASGVAALELNTSGSFNTADGDSALNSNTTGSNNTASGQGALFYNSQGSYNTAAGLDALTFNTTGADNTAFGTSAGVTSTWGNANTSGSFNTFVGAYAGSGTPNQLSNATAIGANATVSISNTLVLGGTGSNAVNVGIGTTSPHSTLQVQGNYVQLPAITGFPPPASDCATSADTGRMVVRTDGTTNLYICTGATGWVGK